MRIIAFAQQKGGVGKSTLCIHLAVEAWKRGFEACVLELDKQGTASFWAEKRGSTAPSVKRIASDKLAAALAEAKASGMEYAFVDLPGANFPTVNPAIRAADIVIIPARPSEVDIVASDETLKIVHRLERRYAYVMTFLPATGNRGDQARDALRAEGFAVAPGGTGDRKTYMDAVAAGSSVQEMEPKGKAAAEIAALWSYIKKQI